MDTQWALALVAGIGAAALWGDPDGVVSSKLGFNRMGRFLGGLAFAALAGAALYMPTHANQSREAKPFAWPLVRMADGKATAPEQFAGKVVVLNLWADWCGPCLMEMPSLLSLRDKLAGRNEVEFVFVAVSSEPQKVAALLQQRGWNDLPAYLPAADVPKQFKTNGIPATFIIDHLGRIERSQVGAMNWDTPVWLDLVKKLADAARAAKPKKGTP